MRRRRALPLLAALVLGGAAWFALWGWPELRRPSARETVAEQLEAFGRGDFAAAYERASSGIRRRYPTPDAFKAMIYAAYPEFGAALEWEVGEAVVSGGQAVVGAALRMPGQPYRNFKYYLVREGGEWRVDGVTLSDREAPGGLSI